MRELWKWIKGYRDYYKVSSHGRVKSVTRVLWNGQTTYIKKGKILGICLLGSKRKYPAVRLSKNGKSVFKKLHHLVLEAFVGPRPAGLFGLHNDDNQFNNHQDNLRWGTQKSNCHDKIKNGGYKKLKRGENHHNAKVSNETADWIRRKYATGRYSQSHLGKLTGINQRTVSLIVLNKTYSTW